MNEDDLVLGQPLPQRTLEQRAIAAGLRWERRHQVDRPAEYWLCDWWGREISCVTSDRYGGAAWWGLVAYPSLRAAQLAVLAAWAKEQP